MASPECEFTKHTAPFDFHKSMAYTRSHSAAFHECCTAPVLFCRAWCTRQKLSGEPKIVTSFSWHKNTTCHENIIFSSLRFFLYEHLLILHSWKIEDVPTVLAVSEVNVGLQDPSFQTVKKCTAVLLQPLAFNH